MDDKIDVEFFEVIFVLKFSKSKTVVFGMLSVVCAILYRPHT